MHSCKLTRNFLMDYALGEESSPQATEALAQLQSCPSCQAEYAAIRNTLRVSRQALSSAAPPDEFWPGYRARLKDKLVKQQEAATHFAPSAKFERVPLGSRLWSGLWKFATTSVRLPVPAALAIALLIGFLFFNLRPVAQQPASPVESDNVATVKTRTVEVPVIQERVVTRTVYVERKARRSQSGMQVRDGFTDVDNRRSAESANKTAMSLAGFKPTDEVKLTVIKGSYQDEK